MPTHIGISGWRYAPWRGTFYPPDLPQQRELEYASRRFNAIEINGSFYSLQRPESYARWHDETPEGFVFTIKGGRYITHIRRLRDVAQPLANFFASGVLRLGDKLGPILWQFPATMKWERERFEAFMEMLPHSTREAAKLARKHDAWLDDRAWTRSGGDRPLRHAIEVRSDSFFNDAYVRLLRRHRVAWVMSDAGPHWPYAEEVTADFIYVRLHGAQELYASGYDEPTLRRWARRFRTWQSGGQPRDAKRITELAPPRRKHRDAFIFFDNDAKVLAPKNAMRLMELMSVAAPR